jgi:DNA-binding LacI/PurR family transcriptional regulator
MKPFHVLSASEQVAAHLREELIAGRWSGAMPGAAKLEKELGVGRGTVEAALLLLEKEGLLINRGCRRGRRIELPGGKPGAAALRIVILVPEASDLRMHYLLEIKHRLEIAGHTVSYADSFTAGFVTDARPLAKLVGRTEADAWLVLAGSRMVLGWISARPTPSFALFGRMSDLEMPGISPSHMQALVAATRRLVALGHRRIVMLSRPGRRLPEPGKKERAFLAELEANGIPAGRYNLPDWEDGPKGLRGCLESLFQLTPPTALIIDGVPLFAAVQQFLAERRIHVPQGVSLICSDGDPHFDWCHTPIAHIRWDSTPLARRILSWAENVARGREDKLQSLIEAMFVEGGTVGSAPK